MQITTLSKLVCQVILFNYPINFSLFKICPEFLFQCHFINTFVLFWRLHQFFKINIIKVNLIIVGLFLFEFFEILMFHWPYRNFFSSEQIGTLYWGLWWNWNCIRLKNVSLNNRLMWMNFRNGRFHINLWLSRQNWRSHCNDRGSSFLPAIAYLLRGHSP